MGGERQSFPSRKAQSYYVLIYILTYYLDDSCVLNTHTEHTILLELIL